ncbi:response regulator [Mycobacterium kansasii]|uniref:response regulator n=1 Tax=Mycobacterium kansasii TaxID=1768 RepID=UPI000CDD455C|nr:response regulator [Mycobacterium kansasii]POY02735.1 response regulator [Mycobacterium kansasii]POY28360.1 response regulator [Mycobacterium kansasii]POY34192.1 response regulator [Mycobacterium kansasii]
MGGSDLSVLVVDDDFRVANMHAGVVAAMPGFTVTGTANTVAAAREAPAVDLALVDVYLPDGSGIDFVRELRSDSMILTAATEAETVRAAMAAGALSYLVKPFPTTELAARLSGYARYRKILAGANLSARDVDAALDALRPRLAPAESSATAASPTKQLVLQALKTSQTPMSAAEVAAAIGISRATAQRYLAAMASSGDVSVGLRYGATGRPEQEFAAIVSR